MPITYDGGTNTITVVGFTKTSPCTFEDIYQADQNSGWGVVSKQGENQYRFIAKLQIGDGNTETWFKDTKKQVVFDITESADIIVVKYNAHFQLGEKTTDRISDGCNLYFWGSGTDYLRSNICVYGGAEANIYASNIVAGGVNRYVLYVSGAYGEIEYSTFDTIRGLECKSKYTLLNSVFVLNTNFAIGNGGYTENTFINKANYAIIYRGNQIGDITMRNINARNISTGIYFYLSDEGYSLFLVDCELERWTFEWVTVFGTNGSCYRKYTFNPIITDKDGNPIAGATVRLYDKDNNLIFEDTTDDNGRITPKEVTYKRYSYDGETVETTYSPHKLVIEKQGYAIYEADIIIDHPIIDDVFVINALTYTYDDIMKQIKRHPL